MLLTGQRSRPGRVTQVCARSPTGQRAQLLQSLAVAGTEAGLADVLGVHQLAAVVDVVEAEDVAELVGQDQLLARPSPWNSIRS